MWTSSSELLLHAASLLAAIVHLLFGLFVLRQDSRASANRLFCLLCVSFSISSASYGLFVAARDPFAAELWNRISPLGWVLSPALILHFFLVFIRRDPRWPSAGLVTALYAPALFMLALGTQGPLMVSGFVPTSFGWVVEIDHGSFAFMFYTLYYLCYCGVGLALVWRWGQRARLIRVRRQARLVFATCLTSLVLSSVLELVVPAFASGPVPHLGVFGLLIWTVGVTWGIRTLGLLALTPQGVARDLLQGMCEAVLLLNDESRVIYANGAAGRLLGRQPAAVVGCRLDQVNSGSLGEWVEELLGGKRSTSGLPRDERLRLPSGRERWVQVRALPMRDEYAQLYGLGLIVEDVTERRVMEERLARADRAAQKERLASVGMLAASVAHEVNNPLGYVTANLELLHGALAEVEQQHLGGQPTAELLCGLEEAIDGTERVRRIVKDLRGFTRVEDADVQAPVELTTVVERALALANNELRHRAQVQRRLVPLPRISANEGRLCQVLLNLLINAAQAIPMGRVEDNTVTVRSWAEPGWLCIEVGDTGVGIAPGELASIFEPFHSTKCSGEGAGLGLAISRRIVEAMGGRLGVESELGIGSRFTLRLPRGLALSEPAPVEARPAVPALEAPRSLAPASLSRQPERLLLVDDEPLLLRAMARLLGGQYQVETASSGREAQERIGGGEHFDLVISDLMMGDVSGIELYSWLGEHRPEIAARMLFVTGGTLSRKADDFTTRLAERTLHKPVKRDELRNAVAQALR